MLHAEGKLSAEEVGRELGVSRTTVFRMLRSAA